ncbi:MAG: RecX family transcriptional regulator [Roseiflexaceae bacterium]|nr:RecX family transcriptional regulator [Roseiflexaceae bacterium]
MSSGTITALRAQINDPQRINLFIDGIFALGISLNTLTTASLFVGRQLSAEEVAQLEASESADKAFQAALRALEARPRSVAEIRDKLRRKEFAPEVIDRTLQRLADIGLIDDAAFARRWVENRQLLSPRGKNALRDELRRKGIDRDLAATVLADEDLLGDQDGQAMALARSALHKYADAPDKMTFTRKLGSYLQRRGYSFDAIRPVVDTLWQELRAARE